MKGLAIGGAAASVGLLRQTASAQTRQRGPSAVLSGTEFDLRIGDTEVNLTGAPRSALTINDSLPGPLQRWREGDTVALTVANGLNEDTSIHWHGILLPATMDGVPGLSFSGLHPGQSYRSRFTVRQSGTYPAREAGESVAGTRLAVGLPTWVSSRCSTREPTDWLTHQPTRSCSCPATVDSAP